MIREIYFRNFMCYRGEHTIRLEPKAYAITAAYDTDPGRSNWGGKSAIFEGVKFCVTGLLNKDRRFDADGWITRGEKDGEVRTTFYDGSIMSRSRTKGSATKVRFQGPHGEASQAAATVALLKHLNFDADDYDTVAYFAQGAMARIIRTEAEKRFDIVRNWLGLAKAEKAEDRAGEIASGHIRELQGVKERALYNDEMLSKIEVKEGKLPKLLEEKKTLQAQLDELKRKHGKLAYRTDYEETIEAFEKNREEIKTLKKEIAEFPEELQTQLESIDVDHREAYAKRQTTLTQVKSLKVIAQGNFDGNCPIAKIECPATKLINADRKASKAKYEEAEVEFGKADKWYDEARVAAETAGRLSKDLSSKKTRLEALKERSDRMKDDVVTARKALREDDLGDEKPVDIELSLETLREQMALIDGDIVDFQAKYQQKQKLESEQATLKKKLEDITKLAARATLTKSIFRATQRRVAERALNEIGVRANDMLTYAGVDLGIEVQWEREGKDPAKTCEMCGMPFPSSQKVKTCATCGTERGLHIVQKLEFVLSSSSGAADDFAGISMQLAAGSWLLNARSSPWASAMIDEPFSQMDRTVRRAAANQLQQLLNKSTFRQLLVISHTEDTVQLYPGQIRILVGKDGDRRIEVTS